MSFNETARQSISRAGIVRVRNALNPLLWLCATGSPSSWLAAFILRDDLLLRYRLAVLGAIPIVGAMAAYFIYMFRYPDRLQSEEFVLRQQELSIIERKGEPPAALDTWPEGPGEAMEENE